MPPCHVASALRNSIIHDEVASVPYFVSLATAEITLHPRGMHRPQYFGLAWDSIEVSPGNLTILEQIRMYSNELENAFSTSAKFNLVSSLEYSLLITQCFQN